jgi:hypothetical protein
MIGLPDDLRIRILRLLTIDDLAECAQVSKALQFDCKHPSLSQIRTATVNCVSGSTANVLQVIRRMQEQGVFERLHRLKLNQPDRLVETSELDSLTAINGQLIKGVKYLDFSVPGPQSLHIQPGVLEAIQNHLPLACDLSLSQCHLPPVALLNCTNVETLRWMNHKRSIPLKGVSLPFSENLKELYMDDSTFQVYNEATTKPMFDNTHDSWIFIKFGKHLEHVSIKNCLYRTAYFG